MAKFLCNAYLYPDKSAVVVKFKKDEIELLKKIFTQKKNKEKRLKHEIPIEVEIKIPRERRTFQQNKTLWALIRIIYITQNGEYPTDEESYNLYLDIVDAYADRTPNQITGELRPIRISQSSTLQAARLIEACMDILSHIPDIPMEHVSEVQDMFFAWQAWRGRQDFDPMDQDEAGNLITEKIWRDKHKVSDATGKGGGIVRSHIVSRGRDHQDIEKSWNWLALTNEEHDEQHRYGWNWFITKHPHLRGRVERARKLAGVLDLKE